MVIKGEREWGGINEELRLTDTYCYILNIQQGPTVQHRELYQYFLINYNEKELPLFSS